MEILRFVGPVLVVGYQGFVCGRPLDQLVRGHRSVGATAGGGLA